MKLKTAFLLLNGVKPQNLPDLTNYDLVCATDGAYHFLEEKSVKIDLITGDFDSSVSFPTRAEVVRTPDQDFTDFEKALQILFQRGYQHIDIFGASGKEQDHFLGNISTAIKWNHLMTLRFYDDYGQYFLIDKAFKQHRLKGKMVSLIPLPSAENIVTDGLKFPLNNENLTFGDRIGSRNIAIQDEVSISFSAGMLLIFIGN